MAAYIVQSPIKAGGKRREVGETVEMDAKAAKALVESGELVPAKEAKEPDAAAATQPKAKK